MVSCSPRDLDVWRSSLSADEKPNTKQVVRLEQLTVTVPHVEPGGSAHDPRTRDLAFDLLDGDHWRLLHGPSLPLGIAQVPRLCRSPTARQMACWLAGRQSVSFFGRGLSIEQPSVDALDRIVERLVF